MVAHSERPDRAISLISRPFRSTMMWQAVASIAVAAVAGIVSGKHGFLSAALGGGIGIIGVLVFALVSQRSSTGSAIRVALRAEAAKILAIVVLLWLSFVFYHDMVVLAFLGAFMVSVLLSGLAFAVSGDQLNSSKV